MKTLGLDIGTNSIGWALVDKPNKLIVGMGSRIIPMGAELTKFEQGQPQTKNANRRLARGARKLNKRYKQRRNKLIYVLEQLEFVRLLGQLQGHHMVRCMLPTKLDQSELVFVVMEHQTIHVTYLIYYHHQFEIIVMNDLLVL